MTDKTPFREVLDELDRKILAVLQNKFESLLNNEDQVLNQVDRLIRMRAALVEPYRRGPLTPLERSQL